MAKVPDTAASSISAEFIHLLQQQSAMAWAACTALNADPRFQDMVAKVSDTHQHAYKAEHLLLRDIIKLFNDLTAGYHNEPEIPVKAKLVLIYVYEKLCGIDLAQSLDTQKINQLTRSARFDSNVKTVRQTDFPIEKGLQEEFVMSVILKRINSNHSPAVNTFINRIAELIVKADDIISETDKALLKNVASKTSDPQTTAGSAQHKSVPEDDSLEKVMAELHELIGMENIKESIRDLTNFLKVQHIRKDKGLKTNLNSLHAVFMGPPGTGKTTVARLLGRIYKHLGYLEKGHLIETDRAGLVAGYVGQTALKTKEIIRSATGGVLFIDEAYSLTSGHQNDFGNEAIEILLKGMEDQRGELVVVVAGYPDEMEEFILSNPGLQSRFNRYFRFDHFNVDELLKIFRLIAGKADFVLSEDAEEKLTEILERAYEKRHKGFGNARTVRNLFEKIIERQANRIVDVTPVTEELLKTITEEDIPEILKTVDEIAAPDEED